MDCCPVLLMGLSCYYTIPITYLLVVRLSLFCPSRDRAGTSHLQPSCTYIHPFDHSLGKTSPVIPYSRRHFPVGDCLPHPSHLQAVPIVHSAFVPLGRLSRTSQAGGLKASHLTVWDCCVMPLLPEDPLLCICSNSSHSILP